MKFLVDMGVSQKVVQWLKEEGYASIHVRDKNMHRASDAEIVNEAKNDGSIVLTCDLDFGDIISSIEERSPSVIILRLANETPVNVIRRLKQVLQESSEALTKGAIISVEETRHRVRLLPV